MTQIFGSGGTRDAATMIRDGGIVAYPTEGVFGLGCDPLNARAVRRVAEIKQRPEAQGFILLVSSVSQLDGWVDFDALSSSARQAVHDSWPGPHTWIVPCAAGRHIPAAGSRNGVAVRVTGHPVAAHLCKAVGGPIVSTSANAHRLPPARSVAEVLKYFPNLLDGVVEGQVDLSARTSQIRDALTLAVLRG